MKKLVSLSEGKSLREEFKFTLSGLKGEYYSLGLDSSDDISGIQDDEVALDPKLTTEEADKDNILGYYKPENHKKDKILANFITKSIKQKKCNDDMFVIEGVLSKENNLYYFFYISR